MKNPLASIGPAIIVAAVVLGPGSILTSSKVGANIGLLGVPVVVVATILMTCMVLLSARLGVFFKGSLCDELASRIGRPGTIVVGLILFTLVALFQSSNNIALVAGLEPMLGDESLDVRSRALLLVATNALVLGALYLLPNLYKSLESLMKILIGIMTLAFLFNFVVVMFRPREYEPVAGTGEFELLPIFGMIGTTFSVAGAFYQAYLVKEKGWTTVDVERGTTDSILSTSILGGITAIILCTSWRVFHAHPEPVALSNVGDVARQLEPSFGWVAKYIFCTGILAGAISSFMVNALIGGTILSDSCGGGSRLDSRAALHLTALALLIGMGVALRSFTEESGAQGTVMLITLAQALTVLGIPALAFALVYLGFEANKLGSVDSKVRGRPPISYQLLAIGVFASILSCVLACITAVKIYPKIFPPAPDQAPVSQLTPFRR